MVPDHGARLLGNSAARICSGRSVVFGRRIARTARTRHRLTDRRLRARKRSEHSFARPRADGRDFFDPPIAGSGGMSNAARWPCPALRPGGWGAASAAPSTHPAKSSAAAAAPARPGVCADADHQGAGSHVAGLAAAWRARVTVFGRVGASTNSARTSTFIIGRMPAGDIAVQDVVRAPHPVWASKTETAVKLRAHIGGGAVTGRCRGASSRAIGLATLRHAGTAPGGAFAQGVQGRGAGRPSGCHAPRSSAVVRGPAPAWRHGNARA